PRPLPPSSPTRRSSDLFVREPFSGNLIPATRLDPHAIALLNLFPAPNNSSLFSNFASNPGLRVNANQFDVRGDQIIGAKDQMFVDRKSTRLNSSHRTIS